MLFPGGSAGSGCGLDMRVKTILLRGINHTVTMLPQRAWNQCVGHSQQRGRGDGGSGRLSCSRKRVGQTEQAGKSQGIIHNDRTPQSVCVCDAPSPWELSSLPHGAGLPEHSEQALLLEGKMPSEGLCPVATAPGSSRPHATLPTGGPGAVLAHLHSWPSSCGHLTGMSVPLFQPEEGARAPQAQTAASQGQEEVGSF